MNTPIYLDYAATTPVAPEVARAMSEVLTNAAEYGNASSVTHAPGRRAQARVEVARGQVAGLIGAHSDEIIFTSGATESSNLAILGLARGNADRGRHLIASRIEHKAVLDACKQLEREGFTVTLLTPDANGVIAPAAVRGALRPDTTLVSIMHVNNEIGVIQDIRAIADVCHERGVPLHTDAAQSVGKLPIDVSSLGADLLAFTAHKLYGPQGIGALYVSRRVRPQLRPIMFGGGQERGLRPGTLPVHQIIGFGVACDLAKRAQATEPTRIAALRDRLWAHLKRLSGVHLNGEAAPRLPEILNVSFEGVEGESLITGLPELALTTGSACSSASGEPSYVLRALGRPTQLAQSSLRFSFGRSTTERDIDIAASAVVRQVERLRAISPAASESLIPGDGAGGKVVQGEAGSVAEGTWVRFHLRIADGSVKAALFQAYGCPHTLAVTSWLTEQLPGRACEQGVPGTPAAWLEALDVPIEKLGRLLTVEDALRAGLQRGAPPP